MAKLHIRLSVEVDVTNEQMEEVIKLAKQDVPYNMVGDLDVSALPFDIDISKAIPCDWDNGGYMPSNWLEYDAVDCGVLSREDVG